MVACAWRMSAERGSRVHRRSTGTHHLQDQLCCEVADWSPPTLGILYPSHKVPLCQRSQRLVDIPTSDRRDLCDQRRRDNLVVLGAYLHLELISGAPSSEPTTYSSEYSELVGEHIAQVSSIETHDVCLCVCEDAGAGGNLQRGSGGGGVPPKEFILLFV